MFTFILRPVICLLWTAFAFVMIGSAEAQISDTPRFSLGEAPVDPRDLEGLPLVPLTRAYIPEAIDLSAHFPPPGDQEKVNSCASWATGYAARSYYALLESGAPNHEKSTIVSPAYLHNVLSSGQNCKEPKVNIHGALKILSAHGVLSLQEYPKNKFCESSISAVGIPERFRIKGSRMVAEPNYSNVSGKERSGLKRDSLDRMRLRLSEGHPVILSMLVGKRMMLMKPGDTYNESVHQTGEVNTPGTGGHAMVITGYDDRKAAFRILNSWGQSWADGGYGWVSYDAVLADARYAMVMDVDASSYLPRPVPTRPSTPASPLAKNYNLTCADIEESKDEVGKPVITGFVSKQAHKVTLDARLRELNIGSNLKVRPWPICEAMLTLREPLRSLNGPKIELTGGERKLKVKEKFSFTVTPPGFPSYLYVFYVEDDGTVVNLAPRSGPIRQQTEANSEPLIFGDGQSGRATFTVTQLKSVDVAGEPRLKGERGHEAVIVIAARAPIQELEEREDQAKPGAKIYRASAAAASQDGPQDRLFLSLLKDIVFKRADPQALPREVAAAMLHLRIEE